MKVNILGTIVSPDYDDDYFAAWIDKGIITPSSRVVSAIENATDPIDLYINSYGGDVFAGGEMLIALMKCVPKKKLASVEVGSIAASMAANIVAALRAAGVSVTAHTNSQLMYHGCYTMTEGGAQHHEDVATSLRNINESVIRNLNAVGITECRAWFSEGREKWIDSEEGLELGLFNLVAEKDADAPAEAKQTAARLAAFAHNIQSRSEYKMKLDETIKAEEPKTETVETPAPVETAPEAAPAVEETKPETPAEETAPAETPAEIPAAEPAPEADIEERVTALANERFAKLQSAHDQKISELTKTRDAALKDLEAAKAEAISLKADIEKLNADLAAVRDQLAKSEQNRESTVASALRPVAPAETVKLDAHRNWQTLMHERTLARRNKQ